MAAVHGQQKIKGLAEDNNEKTHEVAKTKFQKDYIIWQKFHRYASSNKLKM